ncbi:MAG: hypothetical protein Q8R45_02105 [Brevundimonas sp.]|uniref:hypothetical protein n=1 Tax=Brevundimonas sp. TaxID=1871086 RepID=UPI00271D8293|nr:hypothetical protein [Brevundimonas sp.]MDO9586765.1 hypothetical protein [Brevundimonas sp.]MDP3655745.1 hypothetical protein [Brevundimonas sp.]MDZ4108408.1 hypothetical protein [Brevundimonas sp.]
MNTREKAILGCGAAIFLGAVLWRMFGDAPPYGGLPSVVQIIGAGLFLLAPALSIWRRRQR